MSNQPNYKKTRALWYKKLKESGFNDIESDDDNLKSWSSKLARKNPPEIWQAKAAYYHMATDFLNTHTFDSNIDRIIWEYHTNAISVRDIAETLNKTLVIKTYKTAVFETIQRLQRIMKQAYVRGDQDE